MTRAVAALLFSVLLSKELLSITALENFYTDTPEGSGATGEDVPPPVNDTFMSLVQTR